MDLICLGTNPVIHIWGKTWVPLGDFNNDGASDLLVGGPRGSYYPGEAYVFYGNTMDFVDNIPPTINCPSSETLYAGFAYSRLFT